MPGYREEEGVAPHSGPRPTSPRGSARQLALGGRAVLPAHRQAAAEARDRDRDPVQAGAAPAFSTPPPSSSSRTCSRCASSPTRASRCASARRCRRRDAVRTVNMDFRYGTAFAAPTAEATRRCCSTLCSATHPLHRARTPSRAGASSSPSLEAWQSQGGAPHPYEAGTWGPGGCRRARGAAIAAGGGARDGCAHPRQPPRRSSGSWPSCAAPPPRASRPPRPHAHRRPPRVRRRDRGRRRARDPPAIAVPSRHSRPSRALVACGDAAADAVTATPSVFCSPMQDERGQSIVCSELVRTRRPPRAATPSPAWRPACCSWTCPCSCCGRRRPTPRPAGVQGSAHPGDTAS